MYYIYYVCMCTMRYVRAYVCTCVCMQCIMGSFVVTDSGIKWLFNRPLVVQSTVISSLNYVKT